MDKFLLVIILVLSITFANFSEALQRPKRQYSSFSSELNECRSFLKIQSLFGQCGLANFLLVSRSNFYCIGYQRKTNEDPYYFVEIDFENGYSTEYTPPGIIQKTGTLSVRFNLSKHGDTAIILKSYDAISRPKIASIKINGQSFSCNGNSQTSRPPITTTEPTYLYPEINKNSVVHQTIVTVKKDVIINTNKSPECGVQKVLHKPFIANGKSTYGGEFPWHSAIFKRTGTTSEYICGGSLVSPKFILTAGHCFDESGSKIIPDRLTVQLGRTNLKKFDKFSQETDVHSIILHEQYNFTTLNHDIAFLQLSTFVEYTSYVQPICLSKENFRIDGQIGTVAGFGFDEMEEYAKELKQVQLEVIDHWTCLESNRDFFGQFLSNRNYCAGFRNGSNVCSGDSGGGMYFKMNGVWYLRGIVSLGFRQDRSNRCEDENYVLFTDVFKYRDWITKFID